MLENASKDLKCIMEQGDFKLIIKPKEIANVSKMNGRESDESHSKMFLRFNPEKLSCVLETWSTKQIDDFVQKLGFLESQTTKQTDDFVQKLESQTTDVDQQVKLFQQLSQVYYIVI